MSPTPHSVALTLVAEEAAKYGCTLNEVMSRDMSRGGKHTGTKPITQARAAAMARVRQEFGWSTLKMGRFFDRHHSTILDALKRVPRCRPAEQAEVVCVADSVDGQSAH